jgi:hypothetical protein
VTHHHRRQITPGEYDRTTHGIHLIGNLQASTKHHRNR